MKNPKWYGILFALFMIFLYGMGIYDFFMMLSFNLDYYNAHHYGSEVFEYFSNYPVYFLVFWIANLICGLLGPVLFLMRKGAAVRVSMISFVADFLLILLTSIFRNRIGVLGMGVFGFDIFILFVTLLFYLYCRNTHSRSVDSSSL